MTMEAKSGHRRIIGLVAGWFLIVLSGLIGPLPGPGGILVFAAGAALVLRNSAWAKRRYVHLKRRWPRFGHLCDRVMRRSSALRRRAISEGRND
jgi:hypothetical protein